MNYEDSYVSQIKSIDLELKRLAKKSKELREAKKFNEAKLYSVMQRRGLKEYRGIKANKIAPTKRKPRKPERQKRKDAIDLFRQIGIPDPSGFYSEFQRTQKHIE